MAAEQKAHTSTPLGAGSSTGPGTGPLPILIQLQTYDSKNRIRTVTNASTSLSAGGGPLTVRIYAYDDEGFRVRRTSLEKSATAPDRVYEVEAANKYFALERQKDPSTGTEIANTTYAVNNVYLDGVRIASLVNSGQARYFLTDQVDSVNVVTNDAGQPITRTEYLPYGETWFMEGDKNYAPKFNSQELDKESNFYFMNARHYDPELARFVTADSIVDGDNAYASWNWYMYVHGNPVMYKDPTGHLTLILPGTRASAASWKQDDQGADSSKSNEEFRKAVSKTFGEEAEIRSKSNGKTLENTKEDRDKFAREVADYINKHDFKDGEKLNIVAHSHGGNVVKRISELAASGEIKLKRPIDTLVNLGTPQRSDYNLKSEDRNGNDIVKKILNVTSDHDLIQEKGGCDSYVAWCSARRRENNLNAKEINANTVTVSKQVPDMSAEYTTFRTETEVRNVGHGDLHTAPVREQHVAPALQK